MHNLPNIDELRAASNAADEAVELFHEAFELNVRELMEPVRSMLLESVESCTKEEIIGQLLMQELCDEPMGVDQKARLVRIAEDLPA